MPLAEASVLADSAVEALEAFDPLANLAQARILAELRRAQSGENLEFAQGENPLEPGVVAIDQIMGQRVNAWLARGVDDLTAGKHLVEVGRDAVALGHRFWGLSSFIDAIRLGAGEAVITDIEHLVITRGRVWPCWPGAMPVRKRPMIFGPPPACGGTPTLRPTPSRLR
ncbi:MAG TPA: hypothetical protein VMS99_16495 [Acidimicrobiia bacterium]|nr:hypothetical protein [Acidimicrobiia bacterium]